MKPKVVISETLDDTCAGWLAEHAEVTRAPHDDAPAFHAALADAQGLVVRTYTRVDSALLARAPQLRVVGRAGVGLDNIDLDVCRARGVQVVYTPDANTQAVVEYVFALMLDAFRPRRPMPERADAATFHGLRKTEIGRQLDQMTLGIVGFGRIGKRVGEVAHAIGMNVNVCDLLPEVELRKAAKYPFSFLDHTAIYGTSDVVTIHVDGRAGNRHMLNAATLSQLRRDVLLINAARGMLVDAAAMAAWANDVAADGGRAILDVHDPEPPPADYPLHGLPNVTLLPHIASRTDRALANMSGVVRDVWAVLEGGRPQFPAWE